MKRLTLVLLLAIGCFATALATTTLGELLFSTSFDSLMMQSQQTHKLMVIKFYTDW